MALVGPRDPVLRACDPDFALRLRFVTSVQRLGLCTQHVSRLTLERALAMRAGRLCRLGLEAHPCPRTGLPGFPALLPRARAPARAFPRARGAPPPRLRRRAP